jgi:hypothetical protein
VIVSGNDEDQQSLPDEHGFESGECRKQMQKQDNQVAHGTVWFANTRPVAPQVAFAVECATGSRMLRALVLLLRSIGLLCCGHRAVALENLALRQQLATLTRTAKRAQLRRRDRLFWILWFANTRSPVPPVDFVVPRTTGS